MTSSDIALYDGNGIERFRGTQSPGGGSQPKNVRYPFTFATPDLATFGFPIASVDQGAKTFTIAGDHRDIFDRLYASGAGSFEVQDSTGNDGYYGPSGPSVFAGGATTVAINEAIPDATADGTIYALAGGVAVYTPADGDTLILTCTHVAEAFDGTFPGIRVFQQNSDPSLDDLAFDLSTADAVPAGSLTPNGWQGLQSANIQGEAAGTVLVLSAAAGPVMALLVSVSNTYKPPGSLQGSAVLSLLILPAS